MTNANPNLGGVSLEIDSNPVIAAIKSTYNKCPIITKFSCAGLIIGLVASQFGIEAELCVDKVMTNGVTQGKRQDINNLDTKQSCR